MNYNAEPSGMMDFEDAGLVVRISRISAWKAFAAAALLTFVIGYADTLVSNGISFSIFYLIPVTAAVFLSGKRMGTIFSFICSAVWFYAEYGEGYGRIGAAASIWNGLVRLGYFVFHSSLLATLIESIRTVRETAFRDPLTKAANWRYFEEYANKRIKAAVRDRRKLAVAYLDLDNFKKVNDTLGHGVGDQVLIEVARAAQDCIRPNDLFARLGGDEFALLLDGTDMESAREVLERINAEVLKTMAERKWGVTLSVGAMVFAVLPSTVGPMLKAVDDLMYEVKRGGKNGIRLAEQGAGGSA